MIVPFGRPLFITAWAKQRIVNGFPNKYAFAEQYFDKACIMTNGVASSTSAGILSPYGEFLPTMPGPVALVTMSDIDTGQRGTGVVNVIKLQLDVNHDGTMDLSYGGPDNTSRNRPFVFWVNDDFDRKHYVDCLFSCDWEEDDLQPTDPVSSVYNNGWVVTPDCDYALYNEPGVASPAIPSLRDLEDYARLWLPGLSSLMAVLPTNYTVKLALSGDARIRLFRAVEASGGTNYLFDPTTATNQVSQSTSLYLGILDSSSPLTLTGRTNLGEHFIFCGCRRGYAQIDLQVLDGNQNVVGDAAAFMQINNIKEMYERFTSGDKPSDPPLRPLGSRRTMLRRSFNTSRSSTWLTRPMSFSSMDGMSLRGSKTGSLKALTSASTGRAIKAASARSAGRRITTSASLGKAGGTRSRILRIMTKARILLGTPRRPSLLCWRN